MTTYSEEFLAAQPEMTHHEVVNYGPGVQFRIAYYFTTDPEPHVEVIERAWVLGDLVSERTFSYQDKRPWPNCRRSYHTADGVKVPHGESN